MNNTRDLSQFGYREIDLLKDLLDAYTDPKAAILQFVWRQPDLWGTATSDVYANCSLRSWRKRLMASSLNRTRPFVWRPSDP